MKKSCQRSFQALRIDVNSEFEVLYQFLEKLPDVLKDGGKAAILTFHSGEDRLVKKSFKQFYKQGFTAKYRRMLSGRQQKNVIETVVHALQKMRWAIK